MQKDYQCLFETRTSPSEVFDRINRVADWWVTDVRGRSTQLNDEFSVHFGKTYSLFKIIEFMPPNKIVWFVKECYLQPFENKTEWKGTQIVFEISKSQEVTQVKMIHKGLYPGVECYDDCREGWNYYVGKSLQALVNTGKGIPHIPEVEA
ncbi:MAG: ATPase [Bacteroidetes bacterium]|nr:MAG: ATPase [Bacteroidota bacterium]